MKHFSRTGRNRSQHNLVGSTVASPGPSPAQSQPEASTGNTPPSASFSSGESFQQQQLDGTTTTTTSNNNSASVGPARSQTQPPPHGVNIYTNSQNTPGIPQLQHSNTVTAAFDNRQRDHSDFADQVSRSQSHRYPVQQSSPIHPQQPLNPQQQHQLLQQQYAIASPSAEDLPGVANIGSPVPGQSQPILTPQQQQQQQQQPPPAQAPTSTKKSTRKLIKNILGGSSSSSRGPDPHQHASQSSYNNVGGLNRRPSKRVSIPPQPAVRTGPSQVSLDQQPLDWQTQGPPTQPSPLHAGEFQDSYIISESNQELRLQNPHSLAQHATIRPVLGESEPSPYSAEDLAYHHQQAHIQLQGHGQIPPELQQQYQQAVFDQQRQTFQGGSPQQLQYPGVQVQFTGHLGNPQQQNPETVSQLSHESPVTDSDQRSTHNVQSTQITPGVSYNPQAQDLSTNQPNPPQPQTPQQQHQQPQQQPQQSAMAPPPGGAPPNRRSQENEKNMREVQPPPGPPPGYQRHSQAPSQIAAQGQQGNQNQNYRQGAAADGQRQPPPQFENQGEPGQGRNSPQPASDRGENDPEKALKDLVTKYKNVKRLYFDGKKEIEQLSGQVEQLQNAIANQRMSQSRTSLDDNEYSTRFNRLNGAINNLSFNIRKDWVTLPSWVAPFVSADALKTGKQEMTAVGRAIISRWVVEEIFHRSFHPGLEPELSRQLKTIEHNIRNFSYTLNSQEEYDALTSKVVGWRMATLEGLQDVLRSNDAVNHRADFTRRATTNLTASLFQHLTDPPPAGVDGSASMIVELAVGIASNLPLESRDVAILYPLPEQQIQPEIMDVEKTPLPPLEPRPDPTEEAEADQGGKDKDGKDRRADKGRPAGQPPSQPGQQQQTQSAPQPPPKDSGRIRFAGFLAVEVRGRQVLIKAPVWTM
ncbi:hypothetical protein GQ53DRAFT_225719 [Thozetella sp. PMI_491]|nr:hypothetical protein GQ53DRAFT_225719 [Thozetella sp. PMI_491]